MDFSETLAQIESARTGNAIRAVKNNDVDSVGCWS